MSVEQLVEQLHEEAVQLHEEEHVCTRVAPPITSRFLFVNVAAMRAKQLHRRAKPRLDANHADLLALAKAEKIAMGRRAMWTCRVHSGELPRAVTSGVSGE